MKVLPFPSRIVVEITPLCNLACPMCPRHFIDNMNGFMSKELWFKLIDEIALTNKDTILLPFWRGESLVHPDFVEFIEYALNKSLRIHISTNGELVSGVHADVLADCEFVTFSIHTEKGFSLAKDFLKSRKNCKPEVQVSFVTGEETIEGLLNALVTGDDLGGFDSVRLYEEHTKDGVFGKSGQINSVPRIFCPKLSDTLVISADGAISRCNHIWETEKGIDLNETTIKDAWNSKVLSQIKKDYPDKQCAPCDQWTGHTCGESWRVVEGKIEHKKFSPTGEVL